ncbi:MAG: apolipoprotein N-acyltransferase [Bacteroidales bacterium]|nr:apolipoprotein N-acyltransferase [Bacteroidales bacterium]
MKHKTISHIGFSLISAALLSLSWPEIGGITILVFFAFIPLLYMAQTIKGDNWQSFFIYAFASFFIWHIISNYWMLYSTIIGSLTAWLVNSSLMAAVITLAFSTKPKNKYIPFEIILALYWLALEVLHLNWELAWPWMNLGNVFANHPNWIQWYEYTGTYGGTFWIIIINGLIYRVIKSIQSKNSKQFYFKSGVLLFVIFAPLLLSYTLTKNKLHSKRGLKTAIIQTNFNTYTQKFDGLTALEQSESILAQINELQDSVDLIILPEAAIPVNIDENAKIYPKSINHILTISEKNKTPILASYYSHDSIHNYNTAALFLNGNISQIRHKSKLVPFAETLPFEFISKYLRTFITNEGGIGFSYGRDTVARVFRLNNTTKTKLGTLICFESIFTDITSEMVRNGAQIFIIISNDDWWENTAGHRQHFAYARLHAISNRRSIARAANTGISGYIDAYGRILKKSKYREKTILIEQISTYNYISVYSRYEPQIRWGILLISMLIFLLGMVNTNKPNLKKT